METTEKEQTVNETPLLNGRQYVYEIRCQECNKLLAKAMLDVQVDVMDFDKIKTMISCKFGASAPCSRCGKIRIRQATI